VTGVYRRLIAAKPGSVRAFLSESDFVDVGTPADYLNATLSLARAEGFSVPPHGDRSHVDPTAHLVDTVLWDDVEIGAGASLNRCIVADRVKIPAGARFQDCAIIQREGALVVADISHG
jgi:NDP-sugar pyrophosphorylase family protein